MFEQQLLREAELRGCETEEDRERESLFLRHDLSAEGHAHRNVKMGQITQHPGHHQRWEAVSASAVP